MSNYKVEQMSETVMNLLGKNMFFCKDTNVMYWADILGGQVLKMDMNNHNKMFTFKLLGEKIICFCVPIHGKKDQFIVGAGHRLLLVQWDGVHTMGTITKVLCEIPVNGVRFNQCRVDKMGRLYFGTCMSEQTGESMDMHKRIGCFYRFTMTEGLVMLKDNLGMGNGFVWNNMWTKMYFVDSYDMNIYEFDFDVKTGNISNQKVLLDATNYVQMKKILLSGMTIDHEDHLYVALFGGSKILKINTKTHKVDLEIKMNVPQITGCEFGGKGLDTLFVTSAGMGFYNQEQKYPSGYLMKVQHLGVKGVDMHKFISN